jgi:hypothetical protein
MNQQYASVFFEVWHFVSWSICKNYHPSIPIAFPNSERGIKEKNTKKKPPNYTDGDGDEWW